MYVPIFEQMSIDSLKPAVLIDSLKPKVLSENNSISDLIILVEDLPKSSCAEDFVTTLRNLALL